MKPKDLLKDKIFTISNFLSISRILIVPFIVWLMYLEKKTGDFSYRYYQFGGFCLIIFSDFFDGILARLLNQETNLGQYLDPLADKISSLLLGFFLCVFKGFPVWFYVIFVLREIIFITASIVMYTKKDVHVKPNIFGKLCAVSIAISAVVYILSIDTVFLGITLKDFSVYLIFLFFIIGGALYIKTYYREWFDKKK